MRTWEIVVRTVNSVYQLRSRPHGFRKITTGEDGLRADPWQAFQRMGPVLRGQPLRLWWTTASRGRSHHAGVLVTAPVVDVAVRESEVPDAVEPAAAPAAGGETPSSGEMLSLQPSDRALAEVVSQLDEQDRRER